MTNVQARINALRKAWSRFLTHAAPTLPAERTTAMVESLRALAVKPHALRTSIPLGTLTQIPWQEFRERVQMESTVGNSVRRATE